MAGHRERPRKIIRIIQYCLKSGPAGANDIFFVGISNHDTLAGLNAQLIANRQKKTRVGLGHTQVDGRPETTEIVRNFNPLQSTYHRFCIAAAGICSHGKQVFFTQVWRKS